MRTADLSKTLDQTVLAPETTRDDIKRVCDRARAVHVAAVCAGPRYTLLVAECLRGSDVKTCAVIHFPPEVGIRHQIAVAERAVCQGADELDVTMNLSALRACAFGLARDELTRFVYAVRVRAANDARGRVIIKAIVGAPLLDDARLRLACKIVADAGADFAVTGSSGGVPVAVADVELMRESLPEMIGVTAAGGVRNVAQVQEMISAGAARIGTAHAVDVLEQVRATNTRSSE
jgi:deoxyribose-phosphate aldolase